MDERRNIEMSIMWANYVASEKYIPLPCVRFIYYMGFKYPEYYKGRTVLGRKESWEE